MRSATKEERLYARRQSMQLVCETGCRGYGVSTTDGVRWRDEYKDVGDVDAEYINDLLMDARNPKTPEAFPDAEDPEAPGEYVLRTDDDDWAYILRCKPAHMSGAVYVYLREWLNKHIEDARRGVRFIDSHYNDFFRCEDGEKVEVWQGDDDYCIISEVRYIDPTHLEIDGDLYHICELAEITERNGIKICKCSK